MVLALAVVPAYSSGEGAEDAIENYPGISHSLIERHEQSAEVAFALSILTGGIAVFSLLLWNTGVRNYLLIAVLVTASLATISLGIAAHSGGQIRHSELRNSSAINNPVGPVERGDE